MPVFCDLPIQPLTTVDFADLDFDVMGHAFDCQNQIGRLADEQIYEANMSARLNLAHLDSVRQVPVVVTHAAFKKTYFLDLVVLQKGIYEFKTVANLTREHVSQLLHYLYLLDLPRGKLVNFRSAKVQSQFVNAPLSRAERTNFLVAKDHYQGCSHFIDTTVGLLRDLGASLSISLYYDALDHLLGLGEAEDTTLPLSDGQTDLGNQRFHLLAPRVSFRITTFHEIPCDYERQLQSLLALTPLDATQWINIHHKKVTFRTIRNI